MKRMIRKIKNTLFIVSALLLASCTTTYLGRYFTWRYLKGNDYKKMPSRLIEKSESFEYRFVKQTTEELFSNLNLNYKNANYSGKFDDYLEVIGTNSFVVIKNDTIIYEKYFDNFTDSTVSRYFSVTKSFTSSLIGIAIDKHYINSINDKIITYIPELDSSCYGDITIGSLLNMSSGFTINHHYLPWNDEPKTYHSPDI